MEFLVLDLTSQLRLAPGSSYSDVNQIFLEVKSVYRPSEFLKISGSLGARANEPRETQWKGKLFSKNIFLRGDSKPSNEFTNWLGYQVPFFNKKVSPQEFTESIVNRTYRIGGKTANL